MIVAAQQPCFLPWIGYFHKLLSVDVFLDMEYAQYTRGDYFNRVKLDGKWLTVPVISGVGGPINEVKIDPAGVRKLGRSLVHWAMAQKHGNRLSILIEALLRWEETSLVELNYVTRFLVLNQLGRFQRTAPAPIGEGEDANARLWDMLLKADSVVTTQYYSGWGAKGGYMKEPYPIPTKFQVVRNKYDGESIIKVIAQEDDPLQAVLTCGEWVNE